MQGFRPYEGGEAFVFISYSRADTDIMLETISILREQEYRIWYDEGIPGGNDWPLYISKHMDASAAVVFFLSAGSMVSQNCLSEMAAAVKNGKPLICIVLDECGNIIRKAVSAGCSLRPEDRERINEISEVYASRRSSGTAVPSPEDWLAALKSVSFIDGNGSAEDISRRILNSGILNDGFKGKYDTGRAGRIRLNRWLIAIAACVVLFSGIVFEGLKIYREAVSEQAAASEQTALRGTPAPVTPAPTVDPTLIPGFTNIISFPDAQQERAVRAATGIGSGDIEDSELSVISELHFCGKTVLNSAEAIELSGGRWYANGAPVAHGAIKDLSLVRKMYYLERLTLVYQSLNSIEELKDLQILSELDVSDNPIEVLSLSGGFARLEKLNISHTQISDLTKLNAPEALKTVYVSPDMLPMKLDARAEYEVVLVR